MHLKDLKEAISAALHLHLPHAHPELHEIVRKATAKNLENPSQELNLQVIQEIHKETANGVAFKDVADEMVSRLHQDNAHKQYLAIVLISRVIQEFPEQIAPFRKELLLEVAKVMTRPTTAYLGTPEAAAATEAKQAALELLRAFGKEGTEAFMVAYRDAKKHEPDHAGEGWGEPIMILRRQRSMAGDGWGEVDTQLGRRSIGGDGYGTGQEPEAPLDPLARTSQAGDGWALGGKEIVQRSDSQAGDGWGTVEVVDGAQHPFPQEATHDPNAPIVLADVQRVVDQAFAEAGLLSDLLKGTANKDDFDHQLVHELQGELPHLRATLQDYAAHMQTMKSDGVEALLVRAVQALEALDAVMPPPTGSAENSVSAGRHFVVGQPGVSVAVDGAHAHTD